MVEVKIVATPTHYTLAFVSLPDFYFHRRWNKSIVRQFLFLTDLRADRIGARNKLEFENLSTATVFFPCVEKFKESGVSPNAVANLFVNSD